MLDFNSFFSNFPRNVGNPHQYTVYNLIQYNDFVLKNNGIKDCFVSFLAHDKITDKGFMDFDRKKCITKTLDECLEITKRVFKWLWKEGIPTIPTVSGLNGFHLYPFFIPEKYQKLEDVLKRFSYFVCNESKIWHWETIKDKNGKEKNVKVVEGADAKLFGDDDRLCRIINTERVLNGYALGRYCILLDYNEFLSMNTPEIQQMQMSPNGTMVEDFEPTMKLTDFDLESVNLNDFKNVPDEIPVSKLTMLSTNNNCGLKTAKMVKSLFPRLCVREYLLSSEPPDPIRVEVVVELRNLGFSDLEIVDMLARIFADYDSTITSYRVEHLPHNFSSYSCRTLKNYGLCIDEERCRKEMQVI